MKRINTSSFGIVQGSRVLFSDFADGGAMWTGQGPRESRFIVTFKEEFLDPPVVMVGISMWDMDQKHNSRADISADALPQVYRTDSTTAGTAWSGASNQPIPIGARSYLGFTATPGSHAGPAAIQNLSGNISIQAWLAPTQALDLSNEVALDGSGTIEIIYL